VMPNADGNGDLAQKSAPARRGHFEPFRALLWPIR
jgi:hypothetical protein